MTDERKTADKNLTDKSQIKRLKQKIPTEQDRVC
jgi:hypothetical protein